MRQILFHLFFFPLLIFSNALYSITIDCEIVKYTSRYELKNGKLILKDTIVFQINNRNGEQYSKFAIPYSKMVKVSDIEGWIEDLNGKIVRKLKSSDIEERSESPDYTFYEDSYVKSFSLKHNSYPYRIYYTYKITKEEFITIANWSPVFYSKVSTLKASLSIIVPKNCPIKKYIRGATLVKADSTNKEFNSYVFSSKYDRINTDEKFSEPFEDIKPKVVIVPNEYHYGVNGSSRNWVDYGNWFLDLNRGLLGLPESEKKTIDELVKGITDPKEKIKKLYYYLQDHTRYINVSIGLGGFKSYPASYVAENKYGDCKALTNYMKALLEYAGIKSYFTLINSSVQPEKVIEEIPFDQFNHIILTVPLEKDTIWIENTSATEPFGYIGSSIQNRKALFIDENRSRLIKIPIEGNNQVSVIRNIKIAINKFGNGDCQISFAFGGYNYEQYNQLNTFYSKKEQDDIVKELVSFQSYDLLNWELKKFKRDSVGIRLDSRLNIYKFFKPLGSEVYFNLNPILPYSFERPADRKHNLQIPFPINNIDTTIYQIPEGFTLKKIPEDVRIATKFGSCELSTKKMGDSIYVVKKLLIYPQSYDLEKYKIFYEFIKSVKEVDKKVIVFTGNITN
ncbi:MAG: DUF3857 domain-containing protein [Bacteroidia bacterium]|nr:DUF3857 domain-containing protein [Bacteroidia bacterium]